MSGVDVQDVSLLDTAPELAPKIQQARARNRTVREAFPDETWDASKSAVKPEPTDLSPGSVKLEQTLESNLKEGGYGSAQHSKRPVTVKEEFNESSGRW